ncbi:MAG: hypothetical protein LVR00_02325 [Rhabdochlamydiaceae bacterium]|jgi:hypothetical protein
MLDISCLKRWGQELYGSAGRQAPSLSKVTALFLAHRSFMIALGVAFVVGIAWKFYNRTITPLSKIESAQLNRIISTMTADFPSLKTRYTGLSEQILKWEHLKLENPLAPDIQQLFVATFNALSSSPTNGVLVINILTILNAPQPEKKKKWSAFRKNRITTRRARSNRKSYRRDVSSQFHCVDEIFNI